MFREVQAVRKVLRETPAMLVAVAFALVAMHGGCAQTPPVPDAGVEKLLGGPCLSDRPTPDSLAASREIRSKFNAAMKSGDTATAIELQKQLVRYQCANEYLWFSLATLYVQAGKDDEAVAVLGHLYLQGSNDVAERLRNPDDALHTLPDSQAFQESALAKNLAADLRQREERRAEFLRKLEALPEDKRPAQNYVAKNACPFECCTYRTWDVLADTVLYAAPGSQEVVGRIASGEKVDAVAGEVHLQPAPVAVLHTPPESDVPPGSVVFVLDNLGEGFAHVWHEGRVLDLSVYLGVRDQCAFPGGEESCWGEWLDRPDNATPWPVGVWWVQVKTGGGVTGWTVVDDNFGNMDACG